MTERKAWTVQEDKTLKTLLQNQDNPKWSAIARLMEESGHNGRTGKQCRQRWHNHLDPKVNQTDWTEREEQQLFRAHRHHGNKWAAIAKSLPGRTDNAIKNHFYSKLRKGLRHLNKFVSDTKAKHHKKAVKQSLLFDVIAVSGEASGQIKTVNNKLVGSCGSILEKFYQCSKGNEERRKATKADYGETQGLMLQLINQLDVFNKNFIRRKYIKKKQSKKSSEEVKSRSDKMEMKELSPQPIMSPPKYRRLNTYQSLLSTGRRNIPNFMQIGRSVSRLSQEDLNVLPQQNLPNLHRDLLSSSGSSLLPPHLIRSDTDNNLWLSTSSFPQFSFGQRTKTFESMEQKDSFRPTTRQ